MIYITGDTHGEFGRFNSRNMRNKQIEDIKENYMIVCGDLGLCWKMDGTFSYHCDFFGMKQFTLLWVQGNHENYDMIQEFPLEEWKGGKVRHIVRDKIILLERGQVFDIDGKTFFTFGGASSHDIQGGVLDRNSSDFQNEKRKAIRRGIPFRILGESWWKQELPSKEEMEEGIQNLKKAGNKVDYIISHCASTGIQNCINQQFGHHFQPDVLTDYFQWIEENVTYEKWFFGHYHENAKIDDKHMLLYTDMISLKAGKLSRVPKIGEPAFGKEETVVFMFAGEEKKGKIRIIDAYGTFEQNQEPSYDIMVEEENCLYKHIPESFVRKQTV